ncbi:PREDICTED: MFS-type transporter SLC18B1-like [Priapulus caudatus]|uniref:MFS-type transporter SLC18B1-like n=1 Tax=Priapulus caudatus TaxID=37621 RepID=A0ABM1E788_PRICU|nr:PREDICTED: MFS-type transporter SLC18B1-like [Priapulus caudatus]
MVTRDSTETSPLLSTSTERKARLNESDQDNCFKSDGSAVPGDPAFDGKSSSYKYTSRQKRVLVQMGLANFCHTVCFSLIAPFFPGEAEKKGATESQIGFIFSVFELVMFICSPIYGRYVSGSHYSHCICESEGFLNLAPNGSVFVSLCFAVRIAESIAATAFVTASFSIIANEFPGRVATVFGLLETFTGLGLMVGPPIGGLLYGAGGFLLPFLCLGCILLTCAAVSIFLLPHQNDEIDQKNTSKKTFRELLAVPSVVLSGITLGTAALTISFIEPLLANDLLYKSKNEPAHQLPTSGLSFLKMLALPTVFISGVTISAAAMTITSVEPFLQSHLSQFGFGPELVGLIFLCMSGVYTFSAPFWGYLSDKYAHAKWFMSAGCVACFIGTIFIGPSPIFNLPSSVWITVMSLCFMGVGVGLQLVPPFKDCLVQALDHGFPDNFETYGLVSGLFGSCFSFGAFFGPSVGGILVQTIGFGWTGTCVSVVHLVLLIVLLLFILVQWRKDRKKACAEEKLTDDERAIVVDSLSASGRMRSKSIIEARSGAIVYRRFNSCSNSVTVE